MKGAKMPSIVGYIEELDKEGRATSGRNKKYSVKINDGAIKHSIQMIIGQSF